MKTPWNWLQKCHKDKDQKEGFGVTPRSRNVAAGVLNSFRVAVELTSLFVVAFKVCWPPHACWKCILMPTKSQNTSPSPHSHQVHSRHGQHIHIWFHKKLVTLNLQRFLPVFSHALYGVVIPHHHVEHRLRLYMTPQLSGIPLANEVVGRSHRWEC